MSIAFSYRRCSRFFYRRRNLTPLLNILAVDIKPHKILFRDVKNINSSRQIEFTRVSLVILVIKSWTVRMTLIIRYRERERSWSKKTILTGNFYY